MAVLSPEQQDEIMKLITAQTAQLSALSAAQRKEVEEVFERKDQASSLSSAQKWDVAAIVAKMAGGFGAVLGVAAYFAITNAAKETAANLKAEETAKAVLVQKDFLALISGRSNLVPPGSVVAFDTPACPPGWTQYVNATGRVLIGAGQAGGLTKRAFQEQGGAETYKISIEELPPLRFDIADITRVDTTILLLHRTRHA